MSKFYSDDHRMLQDRFDARRMADLMESGIVHAELADPDIAFIESRDMFFLSTVDPSGRPTVSYKGGATGFVRAVSPSRLAFPWYDGNGMYYSAGNLMGSPKVGLLFIDFVTPNRLRIQGDAVVSFDDSLMASYPGAQFLVFVTIEAIWINCDLPLNFHPVGIRVSAVNTPEGADVATGDRRSWSGLRSRSPVAVRLAAYCAGVA